MEIKQTGTILYGHTSDGGFISADQQTGLTAYAYPTSYSATRAVKHGSEVAQQLIEGEQYRIESREIRYVDYDYRNWYKIGIKPAIAGEILR